MGYKQSPFPMQQGTSGHTSALKSISPFKQDDLETRKMQAAEMGQDVDDQGVKETSTIAGQFLTSTGKGKFYDETNDITFSDPQGIIKTLDEDKSYIYKVDSEGNHIITGIK
tara:strand:- start:2013 stop:2348 length:336 start_codon:yes stop_codon:yes gene_type:complete